MYLVRQFSLIEIHVTCMVFFDGRGRKVAKGVDLHLGSTGRSSRLDASAGDSNTETSRGEYLAPCRTQGTLRNPEGGHAGHRTPVRHVSSFFILFSFSISYSFLLIAPPFRQTRGNVYEVGGEGPRIFIWICIGRIVEFVYGMKFSYYNIIVIL